MRRWHRHPCLARACTRPRSRSGQSELEHVPPDPPQTRVHAMPYRRDGRDDGHGRPQALRQGHARRLEWRDGDDGVDVEWDAAAWYGGDFNKLWIETEGERVAARNAGVAYGMRGIASSRRGGALRARRCAMTPAHGPARDWAAFGVAGLAPGFVEVEASAVFRRRRPQRPAANYRLRPAADAAAGPAARDRARTRTAATIPRGSSARVYPTLRWDYDFVTNCGASSRPILA